MNRIIRTGVLGALATLFFANCSGGGGGNGGDPCVTNPMGPGCPQPVDSEFTPDGLTHSGLADSVNMHERYTCNGDEGLPFSGGHQGGTVGIRIFAVYPDGGRVRVACIRTAGIGSPAFLRQFFSPKNWLLAETAWLEARYELGNVANVPANQSPNPVYDVLEQTVYTRGFPGN